MKSFDIKIMWLNLGAVYNYITQLKNKHAIITITKKGPRYVNTIFSGV